MTDQEKKYLSDILRAIELIEDFINPIEGFDAYTKDFKTQSAVERQLGIIGEVVNKFDKISEYQITNARQIVGFRNRIIHAYDAIDSSMIWVVIKKHLTPLKEEVTLKINE